MSANSRRRRHTRVRGTRIVYDTASRHGSRLVLSRQKRRALSTDEIDPDGVIVFYVNVYLDGIDDYANATIDVIVAMPTFSRMEPELVVYREKGQQIVIPVRSKGHHSAVKCQW